MLHYLITESSFDNDLIEKVDKKLQSLGFKPEDLIYHDCGCEALVFRVKNIDDLLLKLSVHYDLQPNPYVLKPAAAIRVKPLTEDDAPGNRGISIALSPYLRHDCFGKIIKDEILPDDPFADINSPLSKKITADGKHPNLDHQLRDMKLEDAHTRKIPAKLAYVDGKDKNSRCLPGYPNTPIIIDKRAVYATVHASKWSYRTTLEERNEYQKAYVELQNELSEYCERKYGKGEACFKKVSEIARGEQKSPDLPTQSNGFDAPPHGNPDSHATAFSLASHPAKGIPKAAQ